MHNSVIRFCFDTVSQHTSDLPQTYIQGFLKFLIFLLQSFPALGLQVCIIMPSYKAVYLKLPVS